MYRINSSLLGLAAFASSCCSAPANAAYPELTPVEARIAKAFDTAVREDGTLESFAALPWAPDVKILGIRILQNLKRCAPPASSAYKFEDALVISWNESADQSEPCSGYGYSATLIIKDGRIEFADFGMTQLLVMPTQRVK